MELTLAQETAHELGELAAEVSAAEPKRLDDAEWIAIARRNSCRLPVEILKTLRGFRHDPGREAALVLHGLPVREETLPPTPMTAASVETETTPPATMLVLATLQLGELMAFRPEKAGALVQNVVPVPGREADQSNAGSTLLEMHVENAFHPHRPDFLGLFCVRGDRTGRAALTVASVRDALPLLSNVTRKVLGTPSFVTAPPPSFGDCADLGVEHAILNGDEEDPDLRVDFSSTRPLDESARIAMVELSEALGSVVRTLRLRAGDLALVDNRLAVHGRTAFRPRYDGRDRWLHRTFVQLNYRQSRAMRRQGGMVLE